MATKRKISLRPTVNKLLKTHGTRSVIATIITILEEDRVDAIDDVLIKELTKAGGKYARAMGLEWYWK